MKPDVTAKGFSAQNAYYFARMSKIVYSPGNEVKGLIVGNATCEGLGFDRFHWFEVGGERQTNARITYQWFTSRTAITVGLAPCRRSPAHAAFALPCKL